MGGFENSTLLLLFPHGEKDQQFKLSPLLAGQLTINNCHKQQNHWEAFPRQIALCLLRQMHNLTSCHPDLELCVNLA